MQSYAAARRSFGALELCARLIVGLGVIVALMSGIAASEFRGASFVTVVMTIVPGIAIAGFGMFGIAYVQSGRAAVDSAEYAQQSLKLARDQYEISKQMLQLAQRQKPATYQADDAAPTNIQFDTDDAKAGQPEAKDPSVVTHRYNGEVIELRDGLYVHGDTQYTSLIDAKLAIDGTHRSPEPVPTKPT